MFTLNGQNVEVTYFPDKTSQVWKLPSSVLKDSSFEVRWDFSSEADFVHLAQLKELLDTYGKTTRLEISYLPYARQDKDVVNDATFALRPFCRLLNALKFDEIILHDPHSSVALTHIQNSKAVYPFKEVMHVVKQCGADLICYPDKGARQRYSEIYKHPSIYGEKVRDQLSGRIVSYQVVGDSHGKSILIVDDICDGGATFTSLAHGLKNQGATEINLFVTHGLFTKGLADIYQSGIKSIFTRRGEVSEIQNKILYKEFKL